MDDVTNLTDQRMKVMNVEALMQVVDWLESGAKHVTKDGTVIGFNMREWYGLNSSKSFREKWNEDCGTVMCIGGALVNFHCGFEKYYDDGVVLSSVTGLDRETLDQLFYPWKSGGADAAGVPSDAYTPENCAKVIRKLISTGKVDWSILAPEKAV